MSANKFADIISRIIGPLLWMPLLLLLLIFKTGLDENQILVIFPSLIFLLVVIPFVYLFIALKMHWVAKWDLPKREERRPMLAILFVGSLISLYIIWAYGNKLILDLYLLLLMIGFITSLITIFWKISIHMILDTTVILMINFLFGWHLWPLLLLLPLVAWARLRLKRHTPAQLLAGMTLSFIIFVAGIKFFNL